MSNDIRIKKGLDIKLVGEAALTKSDAIKSNFYSIKPEDFHGLTPKLLVKAGAKVQRRCQRYHAAQPQAAVACCPAQCFCCAVKCPACIDCANLEGASAAGHTGQGQIIAERAAKSQTLAVIAQAGAEACGAALGIQRAGQFGERTIRDAGADRDSRAIGPNDLKRDHAVGNLGKGKLSTSIGVNAGIG